jgi:DNA-binding CsgD family transcriptional regulator
MVLERTKKWEELNAEHHGRLARRARKVRVVCTFVSERESQVLALSELGMTNGEIAEVFGISIRTVDNHASSARHKLHAPRTLRLADLLEYTLRNEAKNANCELPVSSIGEI